MLLALEDLAKSCGREFRGRRPQTEKNSAGKKKSSYNVLKDKFSTCTKCTSL